MNMTEWQWALVVMAAALFVAWYVSRAIDRFSESVRELGRLIEANSSDKE